MTILLSLRQDADGDLPMMLSRELLPCPFFGGNAVYQTVAGEGENFGGEYIECQECGCSTKLWFPIKNSVTEIVREAWNKRSDRLNRMLSDLWNFMVREDLIDEKLAEEAGPANDHESRGRLNIVEIAERVMARQKGALAAVSGLLEALRDLLDAIPETELEADPPLRSWVNAGREAIAKASEPVNDVGCKPIGNICAEHDEPLVCEHGCSQASPHCSGDPACSETERRS